MNFLKNLILQKCFLTRSIILNANRDIHTMFSRTSILSSNFSFTFQNSLVWHTSRNLTNFKTPVNAGKSFKPQPIPVSKQNQHLLVKVFGQNDEDLGVLSLRQAKDKADINNLKLVMIDETLSPPHAKFLTGKELYELQMKTKEEKKDDAKIFKEKEVDINLGIEDHDLGIKVKMIQQFLEKGHPVVVRIDSKIYKKKVPKMQFFNNYL